MSSIMQILRRIGGAKATPTSGSAGQLALWKAGAAPTDAASLYAHDGVQWVELLDTSRNFRVINANDAVAGLRITQTGAGEALRVEDEANPDASPFVVDAEGKVGVGTSTPGAKMHIDVADYPTNPIVIVTNGATNGLTINPGSATVSAQFGTYTNTPLNIVANNSPKITVLPSGNVGIGTVTPSAAIDVVGDVAMICSQPKSPTSYSDVGAIANDFFSKPSYSGTILRQFSSTAANTSTSDARGLPNAGLGMLIFQNTTAGLVATNQLAPLALGVGAEPILRVLPPGGGAPSPHVTIGAVQSPYKFTVAEGGADAVALNASGTASIVNFGGINAGDGAASILYDRASSLIKIMGGTRDSQKIHFVVNSVSGVINSTTTRDSPLAGSNVVVDANGNFGRASSSIKYKKDVEDLDATITDNAIRSLRPVWYRSKKAMGDDKPHWSHIGLIAEEVAKVEPRLVNFKTVEVSQVDKPLLNDDGTPVLDENGKPRTIPDQVVTPLETPEPEDVDYARLSVLLLDYVQRLEKRIAALEARP